MQKRYAYGSLATILLVLLVMLQVTALHPKKANANIITIKSNFSSGLTGWTSVDSTPFPSAGFASAYDASTGLFNQATGQYTEKINNYLNFYTGTQGSLRFSATGAGEKGARYYKQDIIIDQPRPSARVSFAWKKKWVGSIAPLAQNLFVAIKDPDGKVAMVWQNRTLSTADAWKKVENVDVGALFTKAGTYEIRIGSYLENMNAGTGLVTQAWFDEVYVDLRQNNLTRPAWKVDNSATPKKPYLTTTPFSKGQIDLEWSEAEDLEGIQEYQIYINGHKRPAVILPVETLSGPPYKYSVKKDEDGKDLVPSTLYQFSVRAVDKDGNYSTPIIKSATTTADDGTPATLRAPTNNPQANNIIVNGGFEKNSKGWGLRNYNYTRRTAGLTTAWDPVGYIGTTNDYTYKNGETAANLIPLVVNKGGSFSAYAKGGRSNRGGRYVGQNFTITDTTGPYYLSFKYMRTYGGTTAPSEMQLRVFLTRQTSSTINTTVVEVTNMKEDGSATVNLDPVARPKDTGFHTVFRHNVTSYLSVAGPYRLEFRLYIRNASSTQWSQISIDEVMLYVPDKTPPNTTPTAAGFGPTNFTGNAITDTQMKLSWDPSFDNVQVSKYNIYRALDAAGTNPAGAFTTPRATVSTLGEVTYTDTTVGNTTYYYRVEAVDPRGNKSPQTANLVITTPAQDLVKPNKVTNVSAIGSTASEAAVFWNLSSDPPPGFGIIKYQIYRANDANGAPAFNDTNYTLVKEVGNTITTIRDSGLTAKKRYWYVIRAVDRTNNLSDISDPVFVDIIPSPHGFYDTKNAANKYEEWRCAYCHRGHKGVAEKLGAKPTQPILCLTCHDSYGSQYVLKPDLQAKGAGAVFHPIKDSENEKAGETKGIIKCTDCHNPHGDKKTDGTLYPRWLRSKDGNGNYTYEGNQFCLNCHGQTARTDLKDPVPDPDLPNVKPEITDPAERQAVAESITYWDRTSGNHDADTQGNDPNTKLNESDPGKPYIVDKPIKHFDVTSPYLQPSSGTKITCVMCHDEHTSPNYRLTLAKEEGLCFKCHNDKQVSASKSDNPNGSENDSNILKQFNLGGSRHNIYDDDQEDKGDGNGTTKVECISCHGPHAVSNNLADEGATSGDAMKSTVVSDPFNTKRQWNDGIVPFCINCHGDQTKLPKEKNDLYTAVPYTIDMPNKEITTNVSGWDKRSFNGTDGTGTASGHWTAGVKSCRQCHEQHGSPYQRLTKFKEDDLGNPAGNKNGNGVCFQCHTTSSELSGTQLTLYNSLSPKPPNIKEAFLGPSPFTNALNRSGHLTLIDNDKHSDTEDYKYTPPADPEIKTYLDRRHAECYDCHDPHSSNGLGSNIGVGNRPASLKYSGNYNDPRDADTPPKIPGALKNIQGVGFNMQGTTGFRNTRPSYNFIAEPSTGYTDEQTANRDAWFGSSVDPNDSSKDVKGGGDSDSNKKFKWRTNGITYMHELCYKCHSSYSFGKPAIEVSTENPLPPTHNTWQDGAPDEMTDIAREFNPNNASFHPVEAYGRTPNGVYTGTDSFGDAWGPNRMMYCTDCHGSENTITARGPHGSINPRTLKGTWSNTTTSSTTGALCFRCHVFSSSSSSNGFELNVTPGTYTYSAGSYTGRQSGFGRHSAHISRDATCQSCHAAVPHGWYRRHLIVVASDPIPYNGKASRYLNRYSPTTGDTDSYSEGNCSPSCGH